MTSEEPAFLRDALKGIPLVRSEPIPEGATFPKDERELDQVYKPSLSPQITVEQLHGMHWATGWQYCTVWRQAKNTDRFDLMDPPDGEGWEVNVDREGGSQVTVPRWSDGTVVHQAMYWRRPVKDMEPYRASISEKRP